MAWADIFASFSLGCCRTPRTHREGADGDRVCELMKNKKKYYTSVFHVAFQWNRCLFAVPFDAHGERRVVRAHTIETSKAAFCRAWAHWHLMRCLCRRTTRSLVRPFANCKESTEKSQNQQKREIVRGRRWLLIAHFVDSCSTGDLQNFLLNTNSA